jgi:hypothetical protein
MDIFNVIGRPEGIGVFLSLRLKGLSPVVLQRIWRRARIQEL